MAKTKRFAPNFTFFILGQDGSLGGNAIVKRKLSRYERSK